MSKVAKVFEHAIESKSLVFTVDDSGHTALIECFNINSDRQSTMGLIIEKMRAQWADEESLELFLIRLLPELTNMVTKTVAENLHVDRLTILDGGHGEGLSNYVKNVTNSSIDRARRRRLASLLCFRQSKPALFLAPAHSKMIKSPASHPALLR